MVTFFPYRSRRRYRESPGINVDSTYTVKTEALGKGRSDESPYLIANEWIAANIAQFLRLPVPPFALVAKRSRSTRMFASYSYEGDTTPADVEPSILYERHPRLCAGIVLFDILVANCDRHRGNLKVDKPAAPETVHLIDHDRAMFGVIAGNGVQRLQDIQDRLGVTDAPESRDEWHCLVELLASSDDMEHWLARIADIPDWLISEVCNDVHRIAITANERDEAIRFLQERRNNLGSLIHRHRDRFPRVQNWPLFL